MITGLYFCLCRFIKATSPRLNMMIMTGFVILLPLPLINFITLSASEYGLITEARVLCHVCPYLILTKPYIYLFRVLYIVYTCLESRGYYTKACRHALFEGEGSINSSIVSPDLLKGLNTYGQSFYSHIWL